MDALERDCSPTWVGIIQTATIIVIGYLVFKVTVTGNLIWNWGGLASQSLLRWVISWSVLRRPKKAPKD